MKSISILILFLSMSVFAEEFKGKTVIFTLKEKDVKVKESHEKGLEIYEIEFPVDKIEDSRSMYITNHNLKVKRSQLKKEFNSALEQIVLSVDKKTEKQVFKKTKSISLGDFKGYEFSGLKEMKDKSYKQLQVFLCLEADGVMWDFQCFSSDTN
ncbi:MAG: hypothetical protein NE327_02625, partial [Lentisphaeraceae bacterium]|nr:hypothetical protein [Lentisphaeraceae bacterium]